MGNMKGTGWKGAFNYLVKEYGEDALDRIKENLSDEDRYTIFHQPILPTTWVDYGAYVRFMLKADQVLGSGDHRLIRAATKYNARQDLGGIYRIFISFVSPATIIKNAAKVYGRYFDTGKMSVADKNDKSMSLWLEEYPDVPRYHEIPQTSFIEEALTISGCHNAQGTHPKCMARGDSHCVYEFTWD